MHRVCGLWRRQRRAASGWAGPGGGHGAAPNPHPGPDPHPEAPLELGPQAEADPGLLRASSPALRRQLRGLALVRGGFLRPGEEAELLRELEPLLGSKPYQFDHWDGAITGYRETELCRWGPAGRAVLCRMAAAFPPHRPPTPLVHVLDLHPRGEVRPHVDSVKFCGCTIAGLSLLSPSVMRLQSCSAPGLWLELLLQPGSLYVLRGAARYEFTHQILPPEASFFGTLPVPRGRRLALICRNAPGDTSLDPGSDSSAAFNGGAGLETPTQTPPQ